MKRRTNPARSSRLSLVDRSPLSQLFAGLPRLNDIDSMSDADAWLAIQWVRGRALDCFSPGDLEQFTWAASVFLEDRGLVESLDASGSPVLLKGGVPIAGAFGSGFPL